MTLFPRLKLLDSVAPSFARVVGRGFEGVTLVAVQHLLESTGSLLETLIELGLAPDHIWILGKHYSTSAEVSRGLRQLGVHTLPNTVPRPGRPFAETFRQDVEGLWGAATQSLSHNRQQVVILDDGSRAIRGVPKDVLQDHTVVAVEQTASGLRKVLAGHPPFSVIQVAYSAVKRGLEPRFIAEAVMQRVGTLMETQPRASVGVIGAGYIGRAIIAAAGARNRRVSAFDRDAKLLDSLPRGVRAAASVQDLLDSADLVFGCCGEDALSGEPLDAVRQKERTFVSCSSEDVEFWSILREHKADEQASSRDSLDDVTVTLACGPCHVVRGGYPVNFDGTGVSVPNEEIQLTRGLLLAAVVQAAVCRHVAEEGASPEMLSPFAQRYLVEAWRKVLPAAKRPHHDDLDDYATVNRIQTHSSGTYIPCVDFEGTFSG